MDKRIILTDLNKLGPILKPVENYPPGRSNTDVLTVPDAENLLMVLQRFEPGHMGKYHLHKRAENVFVVLEGTMEAIVGGVRYFVGPGQMLYCPNNIPHTMGNSGTVDVVGIEIYSPPRSVNGEMDSFPAELPDVIQDYEPTDD